MSTRKNVNKVFGLTKVGSCVICGKDFFSEHDQTVYVKIPLIGYACKHHKGVIELFEEINKNSKEKH